MVYFEWNWEEPEPEQAGVEIMIFKLFVAIILVLYALFLKECSDFVTWALSVGFRAVCARVTDEISCLIQNFTSVPNIEGDGRYRSTESHASFNSEIVQHDAADAKQVSSQNLFLEKNKSGVCDDDNAMKEHIPSSYKEEIDSETDFVMVPNDFDAVTFPVSDMDSISEDDEGFAQVTYFNRVKFIGSLFDKKGIYDKSAKMPKNTNKAGIET